MKDLIVGFILGIMTFLLLGAIFPGQAKSGGLILPFCRADLTTTEGGFVCYDPATRKIRHNGEFEVIR